MPIYLPIAETSLNVLLLLLMGGGVGFLSGMFGVGGGFLMTPLLIFTGVPSAVAVATMTNQVAAASVTGALAHWRRGGVDLKMGVVLIIGGAIGSFFGSELFAYLRTIGQVDLMISLSYVIFLGSLGTLMFIESINTMRKQKLGIVTRKKRHHDSWIHSLPFKMRFRKSRLYISALLPLAIGGLVGVLAAIMGVGGGFIMVPAMIYLLGMPTNVVVGTSLFQIIFVACSVTFLHSLNTHTVDVVLALILLVGAVVGAQFGVRVGMKLKAEQLRILLAIMVLGVCIKMAFGLFLEPDDLFSLTQDIH